MLPKELTKNKCNNYIQIDNQCKFNDPNMLYEREYYNPRYLKLKCGDTDENNNTNTNDNNLNNKKLININLDDNNSKNINLDKKIF
jgi:hypothetical protein